MHESYHAYVWVMLHCNILQRTATHCNMLQHTVIHCNTLRHSETHCNTRLKPVACNIVQHNARQCKTVRHTAIPDWSHWDATEPKSPWSALLCRLAHTYHRHSPATGGDVLPFESCHPYKWVMSRTWMSRFTYVNLIFMSESCYTYAQVMSHVWMSHVTRLNESCHTFEWVMSHMWPFRYVAGCVASWFIRHEGGRAEYKVMSHVWLSHVINMNESHYTYECIMSHV